MTKIYLAASYARKNEMRGVRDVLVAAGHTVTSTWIDRPDDLEGLSTDKKKRFMQETPLIYVGFAQQDIDDLCNASVLIMFTGDDKSTGGRHTEFGIAMVLGIEVVIVGPRENVFHCFDSIWHHNSWAELCTDLWKGAAVIEAEGVLKELLRNPTRLADTE